jgi:Porin PorA
MVPVTWELGGVFMRRLVGAVLTLVGAFLIAIALLAQFYVGNALLKTPLDVDEVIHLDGSAQTPNAHGKITDVPVLAWSTYHVDTGLSDSKVASFQNAQCLVKDVGGPTGCVSSDDPRDRLLSATTDDFATDRRTAESVNDPVYLPAGAVPHQGVVNKWPFLAEKKSYTYWDDATQKGVTATYAGTDTLNGHQAYVYDVQVPKTKMHVAEGVKGFYTDNKQIYVDQLTGSVLDQREHQVRTDTKGNPIIDLHIAFTQGQVGRLVDDAEANGTRLRVVRTWVPIAGYVIGIPMFLVGAVLTLRGRRAGRRAA